MLFLFISVISASINDSIVISLDRGFVQEIRYRQVKALGEEGIRGYSNLNIPYDDRIDSVKVVFARTITPEGETLTVGEKSINRVMNSSVSGVISSAFPFLKELIISFPGAKKNVTFESEVTIKRKNPFGNELYFNLPIGKNEKINRRAYLKIELPKGKKAHFLLLNNAPPPDSSIEKGNKVYVWRIDSFKTIPEENYSLPLSEIAPSISVSTFTWEEIRDYFLKLLDDYKGANTYFPSDNTIKSLKKRFEIERLLSPEDISFFPRNLKNVVNSRYITPFELSLMLKVLLGKEARLVLLCGKSRNFLIREGSRSWTYGKITSFFYGIKKNFPTPYYFNHIIVKKGNSYIDITEPLYGTDLPYWSSGVDGVEFTQNKIKFITTSEASPQENSSFENLKMNIDEKGNINAVFELTAKGLPAFSLREHYSELDKTERQKELRRAISEGIIKKIIFEDSNGVTITTNFSIPAGAVIQGNLMFISSSFPGFWFDDFLSPLFDLTMKNVRKLPLNLSSPGKRTINLAVTTPKGYKPYILPDNLKKRVDGVSFKCKIKNDKGHIQIEEVIESKYSTVSAGDANKINDIIKKLLTSRRNLIVLKRQE